MAYWDKRETKRKEPEALPGLEELEDQTLDDLGEVEKSFRERMKTENKRFLDMCDTEYWFCVCFTSRAQKEELLKLLKMDVDEKYIDGRELAKAIKKELKTPDLTFAKIKGADKEFSARAMDI